MPTPDYDAAYPFVDGNAIYSADVFSKFYDDAAPLKSLSTINGLLTSNDLANAFRVDFTHTQRGSHVDCCGSSGTANLDYVPKYVFPDYETGSTTTFSVAATDSFRGIPGGGRNFYSPYAASVLVTWSIFWTSAGRAATASVNYKSRIFLALDGTHETGEIRQQPFALLADTTVNGYSRARSWSGHAWLDVAAGEHNVGLYIISDHRNSTSRIHSVNLNVLQFRTGDAL